jgi:hypothetical protein
MPILVTKTYIVDTDDVDEAHELTKPTSKKVATLVVGGIKPYVIQNNAAQTGNQATASRKNLPGPRPGQSKMKRD